MPPERKVNPVVATIIVIVLVVGLTVGIILLQGMNAQDSSTSETTTSESTTGNNETTDTTAEYTDGEYTATGSYSTPGGSEEVTVTLTLANDIVTAVSAEGSATSGNSAQYQSQFLDGYKPSVEGKDVDAISLSRISGSSLTSDGFNKALEAIKADASA
jgi:uncharacterized protein with FMN-binding domain